MVFFRKGRFIVITPRKIVVLVMFPLTDRNVFTTEACLFVSIPTLNITASCA